MHFNDDDDHHEGGGDSSGGGLTIVGGKIKQKIWQLSVIFFSLLKKVQHISNISTLQVILMLDLRKYVFFLLILPP